MKFNMSVLNKVGRGMTVLSRAYELQSRAATVGFDWPESQPVFDKVREELAELAELGHDETTRKSREEELGDLLFACVNLARHLGVDPEAALEGANHKFERRFKRVESLARKQGKPLVSLPLETLDGYWVQAKREGL